MSTDDDSDDKRENYDSGPFCRHWDDPSDCDLLCARPGCGHKCTEHGVVDGDYACYECHCPEWQEVNQ